MSEQNALVDEKSEKAILGCVLLSNEVIENVLEILTHSDFSNSLYRQIFETMEMMYHANEPIEPLSLSNRIHDAFPKIQITDLFLEEIQNTSPSPSSIEHYAQRVVALASKREAIQILNQSKEDLIATSDPVTEISNLMGRLESIRSSSMDQTVYSIQDLFVDRALFIEKKERGEVPNDVLPTGLADLDKLLDGGLRLRHFDILAARPAVGKSSLAVQFALNISLRERMKSLIFSIEMSKEDIMDKIMSIETKIPYRHISEGHLSAEEWEEMTELSAVLQPRGESTPRLFVDDVTKDLNRMISIIRRCVRQHDVKFVVIDYLQLIHIPGKFGNRDEQLGYAVNQLAYTAKSLGINILALSQLNRGVETRDSKRPSLADLRESGNIEQAAWRVLSIYRDDYYNAESDEVGLAEISVLKGKISNTGKVQVRFDKDCTRFDNLDLRKYDGHPDL